MYGVFWQVNMTERTSLHTKYLIGSFTKFSNGKFDLVWKIVSWSRRLDDDAPSVSAAD